MRALERKLLRDVLRMRGQVLTVALVVGSGITGFLALRSSHAALSRARTTYYDAERFGDVFARLRRAPNALRERVELLPGVERAYTRVVDQIRIPLAGEAQPPVGILVSIPPSGIAPLNGVRLEQGRYPEPGRAEEVVLLARFARRRSIAPGDTLAVVVKGVRQVLRIVGLGNSPEYVYPAQIGSASLNEEGTAVIWMEEESAAAALGMSGAFNDVVLGLSPGAAPGAVIAEIDVLLEPYGGLGAVERRRQSSNEILEGELAQLRSYATTVPLIFLGVSAFLLNIVLSRLVELQRAEIATLKAIGYSDRAVALHYFGFVSLIVLLGTAIGVAAGGWLGRGLTGVYGDSFNLPYLEHRLTLPMIATGALASLAAAAAGALSAARRIMRLAPAEAMRPPAPTVYRPLIVDRLGLERFIGTAWRMVARELERRPLRTALSAIGIALSMGTLIVGRSLFDSIDRLLEVQFETAMRDDLSIGLAEPASTRAAREIAAIPGVLRAEGERSAAVRVSAGHRYRDVPLIGREEGAELRRVVDKLGVATAVRAEGICLTAELGRILGVGLGDFVDVRLLQGERRRARLQVSAFSEELFGLQAYMPLAAMNRFLGEGPSVNAVHLRVDPRQDPAIRTRLGTWPDIATVTSREAERAHIERQTASYQRVTMLVITLAAVAITIGVVYNNARIALSLRSRELASLRVLGFTRAEISRMLLGEIAFDVLLSLAPGVLAGWALTWLVTAPVETERFRWPVVMTAETCAFAAGLVLAAATASALLVRRRLDRLDLIAVLKSRE